MNGRTTKTAVRAAKDGRKTAMAVLSESHPLPHPEDLRSYEEIHPGATAVFLDLMKREMSLRERTQAQQEIQQAHQHVVDLESVEEVKRRGSRDFLFRLAGQVTATSIVGAGLLAVVAVVWLGQAAAAAVIAAILVGGGAATIRRTQDQLDPEKGLEPRSDGDDRDG